MSSFSRHASPCHPSLTIAHSVRYLPVSDQARAIRIFLVTLRIIAGEVFRRQHCVPIQYQHTPCVCLPSIMRGEFSYRAEAENADMAVERARIVRCLAVTQWNGREEGCPFLSHEQHLWSDANRRD